MRFMLIAATLIGLCSSTKVHNTHLPPIISGMKDVDALVLDSPHKGARGGGSSESQAMIIPHTYYGNRDSIPYVGPAANEDGFVPVDAKLPTPPPLPPIAKASKRKTGESSGEGNRFSQREPKSSYSRF